VKKGRDVIRTMARNAFFGERALLKDEPRTASVEVSSHEVEVWYIEKATFAQILNREAQQELLRRIELQDTVVELKDLKQVKVVGCGATGVVRLVEHKKSRVRYALKRVKKERSGKIPEEVRRECELLLENDHPFIMKLVKTYDTPKGVYMLTELITGGELHGAIRQIPQTLNSRQAQFYTGSLLIVLEELADRQIVYRDLKPENVMLDSQGYLKLIDFGIAKKLDEDKNRTFTMVGTPHYMAPEVMRGQGYGCLVDIWSLGVIQYEFVCGYLPFADDLDDPSEVCHAVLKATLAFPHRYRDANGRTLMQGLLCRQPKKRMGSGAQGYDEIRTSPYFQDNEKSSVFDRIMARELVPPMVPKGETYCSDDDAKVRLSDGDLLG
jgi:cGMP-dependent protein kinase